MAYTHVQSTQDSQGGGGTTSVKAFVSNVTAGNLIVVAAMWNTSDSATPTCSDNLGNTYTEIGTHIWNAGFTYGLALFYAKNVTGGACTVTVSYGGSKVFRSMLIHEYSGGDTTAPFDVTNANTNGTAGAGANNATSNAVTPANNGSLIFGVLADITSGTISAGTGFTSRQLDVGNFTDSEDQVQGTAGSIAATWSVGNGDSYIARVAAFKPVVTLTVAQTIGAFAQQRSPAGLGAIYV